MESREQAICFAEALYDKKASDIEVLDIGALTIIADYFVIASATSQLQAQALADALTGKAAEAGIDLLRVEGLREGTWVLMDFGTVVVHIFKKDIREFYGLERLWADAERIPLTFTE
ncbi:MAG: ribosome silencing factor [Ruminococcaceae bacterium]|nr:ribosome silencing factor [Oscillospiraceae bacterium]